MNETVETRSSPAAADPSPATLAETPDAEAMAAPSGPTCADCGAPVDDLDRFCNACGATQPHADEPVVAELVQKHVRCKNCGAEIAADPDRRSYVCPFCDSTYVVEFSPDETDRQRPEFVLGFAVTREQAQQKFRQWLAANSWFRPGDLHRARIAEKLQGVYLPFWSFSMLAESTWSASIGEYWHRTETYTTMQNGKLVTRTRQVRETEWWPLDGRHHRYYSGYLVSGSGGLAQEYAERIKPFRLEALKRYRPDYLAGWLCEEYSLARDEASRICQQEFNRREQSNVAAFLPGDTHRNLGVRTDFSNVNSDLVLLPVYLLTYRYKDKLYRFLINGQTGKAAGDKPLSQARITAAATAGVLLVLAIIFAIIFFSTR